jgi:transposase, IS30 family
MKCMRKRKTFKHLSYEERVKISVLHGRGLSVREIAGELGRHHSCIAYELAKRKVRGAYIPKKAQHKAYWKRYMSKRDCMKAAMSGYLSKLIREKLEVGWSPERIAGYASLGGTKISTKAVYKFVYSRCLDHFLFWRKNHKRSGWKKYRKTLQIQRNFIDQRPFRNESGHLEADFIVSSLSLWCLLVVVDRHTRFTRIEKLPNRKQAVVLRAFERICRGMPVETITVDNDIAFGGWKQLEQTLKTKIYFCHPYHSWEKGLVENTNRWIRCFVRKKRDIGSVSEKELEEIQTFLNTVPRKVLGFRSANELQLTEQVSKLGG